jgi:hypothetical protein
MLASVMEMVGECSGCTTSHPGIMPTPVNHRGNFVPPQAATVPTHVHQEKMDLTVANANTKCCSCYGFGHEA